MEHDYDSLAEKADKLEQALRPPILKILNSNPPAPTPGLPLQLCHMIEALGGADALRPWTMAELLLDWAARAETPTGPRRMQAFDALGGRSGASGGYSAYLLAENCRNVSNRVGAWYRFVERATTDGVPQRGPVRAAYLDGAALYALLDYATCLMAYADSTGPLTCRWRRAKCDQRHDFVPLVSVEHARADGTPPPPHQEKGPFTADRKGPHDDPSVLADPHIDFDTEWIRPAAKKAVAALKQHDSDLGLGLFPGRVPPVGLWDSYTDSRMNIS